MSGALEAEEASPGGGPPRRRSPGAAGGGEGADGADGAGADAAAAADTKKKTRAPLRKRPKLTAATLKVCVRVWGVWCCCRREWDGTAAAAAAPYLCKPTLVRVHYLMESSLHHPYPPPSRSNPRASWTCSRTSPSSLQTALAAAATRWEIGRQRLPPAQPARCQSMAVVLWHAGNTCLLNYAFKEAKYRTIPTNQQVRDLRRLIELYQRWQHRVFPHGSFDAFQATLERLSGKGELRVSPGPLANDTDMIWLPAACVRLGWGRGRCLLVQGCRAKLARLTATNSPAHPTALLSLPRLSCALRILNEPPCGPTAPSD